MARKQKQTELRIHITNPDEPLDPGRLKQLARWLLDWGLEQGTITPPAERGADYGKKENAAQLKALRREVLSLIQGGIVMTTGKITHAIAIYEMENGEHAALIYGTEGTAAECYDYIMAKAADGETHVKYGGSADEFILAMGELIERRRAAVSAERE